MTTEELIESVGDVITKVDVERSTLDRDDPTRIKLDNIRDALDTYQRKLVRSVINESTDEFKSLTASLQDVNSELKNTIDEVTKTAEALDTLVKLVGVVERIVALIP